LDRYGLSLHLVAPDEVIPARIGASARRADGIQIFARLDTAGAFGAARGRPFYLHDAGTARRLGYRCRRRSCGRECVCYLQIILAQSLPNVGRERMCRDMDEWAIRSGWEAPRSGSIQDAEDARDWLMRHGVLDSQSRPTYAVDDP